MDYEWDDDKEEENLRKHGVDFIMASAALEGPLVEEMDDREDYGELRMVALGNVEGTVYLIVYTDRGNMRRIISARKASKHDRKKYYEAVFEGY